jgi:hypothetical protein
MSLNNAPLQKSRAVGACFLSKFKKRAKSRGGDTDLNPILT